MLYSELHCSEAIHKAVEQMGFAEMTEIQEKTIPVMLAGRDVIAKAPTGTGKTCAFGIPVAEQIDPAQKVPQAVILAPTRELAQQIADELTALTAFMPGVAVACVYGGANMEKQAKRLAEGCQIVVATPGRLMDHYKHHSIDLSHVTQIVLDEADEMLNMGFYKDVRHIIELMKARKHLSMFSATISREVMDIGWLYQHNAEEITVQPKEESQPKITQYMLETSGRNKLSDLAQIIIGEGYKRVMVFCDTKFNTAAGQPAGPPRLLGGLPPRRPLPERAQPDHAELPGRQTGHPRGHRRGSPRHRRLGRGRRHQLRRPRRQRTLHPPHRPHRPRQKRGRQLPVLCAGGKEAGAGASPPDPQHGTVHPGPLRFQP